MGGGPKSLLAFEHLRQVLDRAIESVKGIRIPCENHGKAVVMRSRLNYLRKMDRDESKKVRQPDDYMYGRSPYDRLVLKVARQGAPDDYYVYILQRSAEDIQIEELTNVRDSTVDHE